LQKVAWVREGLFQDSAPGEGKSRSSDSEQVEIDGDHDLAAQVFLRSHEEDEEEEERIQELNTEDSDVEQGSIEETTAKKAA
jgi:hypothetical protein